MNFKKGIKQGTTKWDVDRFIQRAGNIWVGLVMSFTTYLRIKFLVRMFVYSTVILKAFSPDLRQTFNLHMIYLINITSFSNVNVFQSGHKKHQFYHTC
jgi:hypothetical protein